MKPAKIKTVAATLIGTRARLPIALAVIIVFTCAPLPASAQQGGESASALTPLQLEIEKQRRRLGSSETEERRDAVMRLGALKRPEGSRVAMQALHDSASIVRATSVRAVLALPPDEAAAALLPLARPHFARR